MANEYTSDVCGITEFVERATHRLRCHQHILQANGGHKMGHPPRVDRGVLAGC